MDDITYLCPENNAHELIEVTANAGGLGGSEHEHWKCGAHPDGMRYFKATVPEHTLTFVPCPVCNPSG